jgi:F0F1-type ATP synthase assembly protein I
MDLSTRRELNKGFGDTLNRSFEFVVVALMFLGAGWLVDRWLGTDPVFLVVFVIVGFIGQGARMWYRYDAEMRAHESKMADKRALTSSATGTDRIDA